MYSFSFYAAEPAPEREPIFAQEGTSTGSVIHPLDMGSPVSPGSLSSAGESGFGESDFFPYEYCPNNGFDLDDQFDLGIGSLIHDITVSSESPCPEIDPTSLVEIKQEMEEPFAEVELAVGDSAPTDHFDQGWETFGNMKIEEEECDTGSGIMVPIKFIADANPTQERMILKASRKLTRKGRKIPATAIIPMEEAKTTKAVNADVGESEIETDKQHKAVSPRKRLYEMDREECESEKQWVQVKRAKNTYNFHEKQRKKIVAAEEIISFFYKTTAGRRAARKNAKIMRMLNDFFTHALQK